MMVSADARRVPTGATPAGDGVLVGDGPVQVDAYVDFLCLLCKRFELSAESVLAGLVSDGRARIAYHPMNFLDEASTTGYSTSAAAASGCAADQRRFMEVMHALFKVSRRKAVLVSRKLIWPDWALPRGSTLRRSTARLSAGTYLDWPSYVTERAVPAGVSATTTVLVGSVPVCLDLRGPSRPPSTRPAQRLDLLRAAMAGVTRRPARLKG